MPLAITAAEVREVLEASPSLTLPATMTNGIIESAIEQKTAEVMSIRGITSLPGAGSLEDGIVKSAVLELTCIRLQRFLRPDDAQYLQVLVSQEKLVTQTLKPVEKTGPSGAFFEVD